MGLTSQSCFKIVYVKICNTEIWIYCWGSLSVIHCISIYSTVAKKQHRPRWSFMKQSSEVTARKMKRDIRFNKWWSIINYIQQIHTQQRHSAQAVVQSGLLFYRPAILCFITGLHQREAQSWIWMYIIERLCSVCFCCSTSVESSNTNHKNCAKTLTQY